MRRLLSVVFATLLSALPVAAQEPIDLTMVNRIKQEGLQRSRAQELYLTLTDRIGARLTGSPAHVQAAEWAQERFTEFGLANPRLEPFAFVHGWSLEKISVEMTAPRYMPLIAYAEAWTPSLTRVVSGRIVYLGNKTAAEVDAMAEQLRGAIVLAYPPQTQFLDADRPQPGLSNEPIQTGNPTSPPVRAAVPVATLQRLGAAVVPKPSPFRDGTVGVLGSQNTAATSVPSSWHTANGATDNADGAIAAMEAMRILTALKVQPRRTIRVALWSGEEQGLLVLAPTSCNVSPTSPLETSSSCT